MLLLLNINTAPSINVSAVHAPEIARDDVSRAESCLSKAVVTNSTNAIISCVGSQTKFNGFKASGTRMLHNRFHPSVLILRVLLL